MYQHAARAQGGPPRMALDEKLGELRVCKQRLVGAFGGQLGQTMKKGQGIVWIDRAGERHLDLPT
jgi:hypothetical protein